MLSIQHTTNTNIYGDSRYLDISRYPGVYSLCQWHIPPQVYVPCVMTVSVSWMSFWLDHKAVRKGCLSNLITSTLVPENVSRFPILSKTSYCAGARESCPRGDHSAGNVHNTGLDILQKPQLPAVTSVISE